MTLDTLFCGRYRVLRRLGSGGTATVFLAEDERLEREVAVKRLHGAEVTDATAQRLRREARIMASLRHPNLVAVYDMLAEDDDLYLVMEYVGGETLSQVLRSAPLEPERVLELLSPVAEALDHAHAHGVVHRDVKPSNVLVGAAGVVKLADLGLATAAEITRITPPGSILGTPAYMAPEQARPMPCTQAVDVYALATIAFEALSGTLPRAGKTALAVLRQASEPVPDVRARRPELPAGVAAALVKGMALDPADRQSSASALLRDLADALEAGASERVTREPVRAVGAPPERSGRQPVRAVAAPPERSGRHPPRERPRRNRAARALALLALAAAAAVVVAIVVAGGTGEDERAPSGSRAEPTATATADEPTPEPTPRALSATATVRAFYRRAAEGDFAGAWRLAGPGMRSVFGDSRAEFERQLSSLERIQFERLAVVERADGSATVEVSSIATHADRVDRCSGTLRTVRSDSRWLVEPAGLQCTSG